MVGGGGIEVCGEGKAAAACLLGAASKACVGKVAKVE